MTSTNSSTAGREARLDEILTRYLSAADAGRRLAPSAILALYPDLAEELREFFADHDRVELLAAPLRAASAGETPRAAADTDVDIRTARPTAEMPVGIGAYQLLEEIGRGGMAVVWKGWHTQLNRTVAIKTIRPDAPTGPAALARFRAEAQAVARLQHANIVQIFEVADHDGRPYLVLEYVDGGSLAQRLDGTPVPAADAATLVEMLARAVDYAHRRGVVHRDLKPANILLVSSGVVSGELSEHSTTHHSPLTTHQPKITDFGLAVLMEDGADRLTETGTAVGTPTYMAPEQARGRKADIGPGGDIHALGVILYELLTGRPPFIGVSKLDTLLQVMRDPAVPPRRLQPGVPRDLQTICLKCLEKDPARRYATAALFADDLRRFLDGRPILARPVGPLGRLTRWCRRQPVVASLFFALAVCTPLLAVQWWRAEHHAKNAQDNFIEAEKNLIAAQKATKDAETNLEEANKQRAREQESFELAHMAVKDIAQRIGEKELATRSGLQPLQKELAERTIRYYQEFLKQRSNDVTLRAELADTCRRAGRLTNMIGSKKTALTYYAQAADLYAALLREFPDDPKYLFDQGQVMNERGNVYNQLGRVDDARREYLDALALFRRMQAANVEDLRLKVSAAHVLNNLGGLESDAAHYDVGLKHFNESLSLRTELVRADPRSPNYRQLVADVSENIGGLLGTRLGRQDDALKTYRVATGLREELANEYPNSPDAKRLLANSYRLLGAQQRRCGCDLEEVLATLQKAQAVLERVARENPSVTQHQADLVSCLVSIADAYRAQKKFNLALAQFQKAREKQEILAHFHPTVPGQQAELANIYFQIGVTHFESGRRNDAGPAYEVARGLWEKALRANPENLKWRADYSNTLNNLGLCQARQGRVDEAIRTLQLAVAEQRAVLAKAPMVERYQESMARRYAALAEVERKADHPDAAVATARARLTIWPDNPKELFDVACDIAASAGITTEPAARRKHVAAALDVLNEAVSHGFRDADTLTRERVLDPLRDEERFKQLLNDLRRPK
jgi:serine/threonine protein kinase/tetratricopeptide (TPR) repeat protein